MVFMDIIEFFDESGEIIIARIPQEGSGEFRMGSQLIVQENQVAYFHRDGKCLDGFEAGRYTLETNNLPVLAGLYKLVFKTGSPFRAYVYFLSTKTFTNIGWGTSTPVLFRDAEFRMVSLRAHGAFSFVVSQPRLFMETLVGTRGFTTTFALEGFFKTVIVSRLNEVIGNSLKSILDLPVQYNEIALGTKQAVKTDFEQYGLELIDLLVEAITVPPDVQDAINRATGVAVQDADKYGKIAVADAMLEAAKNPGGTGEGMGAGLGIGMGFGLASQMASQLPGQGSEGAGGQAPAAPQKLTTDEIKTKLREIKEMKEEGLLTDSDFEELKKKILSRI